MVRWLIVRALEAGAALDRQQAAVSEMLQRLEGSGIDHDFEGFGTIAHERPRSQ
jgi:hypothetical protein